MLPVSEILRWLVVVLLMLAFLVVAVWPGINIVARLVAMAGCICGILMAMLLSQPFLWAFCACVAAAALISMIDVNSRVRTDHERVQ
ncbi:MAG: hypothetical protein L0H84_01250 [Pseudonocardia sp.]|nr:hypothetical protein [Pseudonocardia sp.]